MSEEKKQYDVAKRTSALEKMALRLGCEPAKLLTTLKATCFKSNGVHLLSLRVELGLVEAFDQADDQLGDARHFRVVETIGGVAPLVVMRPPPARQEIVRNVVSPKDAVIAHVAHITVQGGDDLDAFRMLRPVKQAGELRMAFAPGHENQVVDSRHLDVRIPEPGKLAP